MTDYQSQYNIAAYLNMIRKPESTVLNFDASPWMFNCSYGSSPACGILSPPASCFKGGGLDPTVPTNYNNVAFCPNIGFIHGTAGNATRYLGNFSYVDGHVGTMTSDILTDTTDYVFTLKK